jgi:lipoprotein-anchoring transpeptidase ErfK/SrfK
MGGVMKAIVSIVALGGVLAFASTVLAADTSIQPLTRVDCDQAGMRWSEQANVCAEPNSTASTQSSTVLAAHTWSQPLTRSDCDKAGMRWDDRANVCADTPSQPLTKADCDKPGFRWDETANVCSAEPTSTIGQAQTNPTGTKGSNILIAIDKTKQRMSVFIGGSKKYDWRVSTGRPGYSTPSGTYTATSMNEVWYSKEWDNAPMPHAIFFMTDGHAIHGSYEVKSLGIPVSHGCVRIAPKNATILYALVGKTGLKNTEVVLTGITPGGEHKVANQAGLGHTKVGKSKAKVAKKGGGQPKQVRGGAVSRYAQRDPGWHGTGDQFPRRRGFFGRLFGGPAANGPQGYYRPPPTRGY